MDLVTAIKEIKDASKFYGFELTEAQQEVLNCKSDYVTVYYSGFQTRQVGRSFALLLKALKLSEQKDKTIYISGHSSYLFNTMINILSSNNMTDRIHYRRSASNVCTIDFNNGSSIIFKKINQSNYRGVRCDYVFLDDVRLIEDEQKIASAVYSVTSNEGQAFMFMFGEETM